jgi:hypothetical protein
MLRLQLHPNEVFFPLRDASFRATQVTLATVEHFRAPIQAILTLTDALLKCLQLLSTRIGLIFEFGFGTEPMFFSLQQRLFAYALSFFQSLVPEALRFGLKRLSLALNSDLPQQISAQEAPASHS